MSRIVDMDRGVKIEDAIFAIKISAAETKFSGMLKALVERSRDEY